MIKKTIYQDEWYPVYGLGELSALGKSPDPVSQFSEEEIASIYAAENEFCKWQEFLEKRFRRRKEASDE